MNDKTYIQMMLEAHAFTKEMGLDISDVRISALPCSIDEIGASIFT